jgi:hypothetical protein
LKQLASREWGSVDSFMWGTLNVNDSTLVWSDLLKYDWPKTSAPCKYSYRPVCVWTWNDFYVTWPKLVEVKHWLCVHIVFVIRQRMILNDLLRNCEIETQPLSEYWYTRVCIRTKELLWSNLSQRSRDSDWLRAGRQKGRSSSPGRGEIFLFPVSSRPVLGPTQPPILWVTGAFSPQVKRPGREADYSLPTSAEVKNTWICTSTPPYVVMA